MRGSLPRFEGLDVCSILGVLLLASAEVAGQPGGLSNSQGVVGGQVVLPSGFPPGQTAPPDGPMPGRPPQLPPRDQTPQTGTSRLRGRVVTADPGQPLRKAMVRLTSPEVRESRSTAWGADGMYEFRDLPAGRYTLNASKGSYVPAVLSRPTPLDADGSRGAAALGP